MRKLRSPNERALFSWHRPEIRRDFKQFIWKVAGHISSEDVWSLSIVRSRVREISNTSTKRLANGHSYQLVYYSDQMFNFKLSQCFKTQTFLLSTFPTVQPNSSFGELKTFPNLVSLSFFYFFHGQFNTHWLKQSNRKQKTNQILLAQVFFIWNSVRWLRQVRYCCKCIQFAKSEYMRKQDGVG